MTIGRALFSNVFQPLLFIRVCLFMAMTLGLSTSVLGQVGVGANFGVEADAYSGDATSGVNTDDWFYNGVSGFGVIDETTAITMGYAAQLAANNNISFDLRQSIPNYATNNGYIWYSTRYARDYTNLSSNDLSVFTSGKNGDNPLTAWGAGSGSTPAKTDIVDAAVHMRRNGINVTDDLWVDLMISTLSSSGNHFIDFELFVSEIQTSGSGFTNSGTQEGHTAWEFDGSGNVTQIGDMVIGFSYSGGGVSGVEVRLWVDRSIFSPGSSPGGTASFTWGPNIDGGSTYGYGQIVVPAGSLLSNVNSSSTLAPPWGTTNTSGYSANYNNDYFAEVALNFTQLGFDPRALFGSGAACDSPFSALLAKSRTSSSFTSSLKDFAGPLDFLGSAEDTQVNTTIIDPGPFDSCVTGETRTLQAEFYSASAEYTWYSLTPGVVFPANGLDTISGVALDAVVIDTPGEYQLGIAPLLGCDPVVDNTDILGVWSIPCPQNDSYILTADNTHNIGVPGLLNNDTDNDPADLLSVNTTPVVAPSNGSLTLNANGSFSYTPIPGYTGSDSFTYEVCDSHGLCDTAIVNIVIVSGTTLPPGVVNKQLYLSDPAQALDRIDPVATVDVTTVSSPVSATVSTVTTCLIAIKDTGIKKKKDDENYGACEEIVIDRETNDIQRALFEFDLSSIPLGATILSAELRLNCTDGANMDVSVFQIGNLDAWDEGSECDNDGASNWIKRTAASNWSQLGAIGPGTDAGTPLSTINVDSEGIQIWPLTSLVSDWYSGAEVNNGIILGVYKEGGGMGNREATYDSRETTTGIPPTLQVTYSAPGGISFTQTPAFCSPFTIKAGQLITVTNYISVTSGSMPANPDIKAVLKFDCNTIASLTNPSYDAVSGLLTWTTALGADSTIPSGEAITLQISSVEAGVDFSIDYDSQTKPSKIELPTSTYIDIVSNAVYDAPYPGGSVITNAYPGDIVYNRVEVTDPFGAYDITGVDIAIPSPGTLVAATEVASTSCSKTYEYVWDTTGFAGTYNLSTTAKEGYENTVTDVENLSFTISFDTDLDGISDLIDIDDDNDGIPDFDELNTVTSNAQPPCGGETVLDFSTPPTLVSGTALSQGAVYRFPNITAGTDALVTIEEIYNATVPNIDNNSSDPASFKPQTAFNLPNIGDQAYVRYKFNFVNSGGSTPVVIPKFFMNFNDIDGGANYGEQNWADNPATYTTSNPTELNMNTNGSWVIGTAGPNDYPGAGNGNPQVNFSVNYNSRSEIAIRVGAVARVPGASAGGRQHAVEFACITNYVNPVTYGIDKDSDGIANHLDLDADNDGIYDAVEAGHGRAHTNGVINGGVGANGLADIVETAPESGTLNYSISNADATAPPDYLDTDSDDDGCSDANEAYNDPNADGGDNEYYDTGNPPVTDAQGRVTTATYPVPVDIDSNSTADFLEADSPPGITVQPVDTQICPGCIGSIMTTANDADGYQWQIFSAGSWSDLSDGGLYSGTTSNTLTITNPTTADNGLQYRIILSNSMYICTTTTSDTATLLIRVNTAITNRKITYRVNRN